MGLRAARGMRCSTVHRGAVIRGARTGRQTGDGLRSPRVGCVALVPADVQLPRQVPWQPGQPAHTHVRVAVHHPVGRAVAMARQVRRQESDAMQRVQDWCQ